MTPDFGLSGSAVKYWQKKRRNQSFWNQEVCIKPLCLSHCGTESDSSNNGWKMNPARKLRLIMQICWFQIDCAISLFLSGWSVGSLTEHLPSPPSNSLSFVPLISQTCHDNFVLQAYFSLASSLLLLLHWDVTCSCSEPPPPTQSKVSLFHTWKFSFSTLSLQMHIPVSPYVFY